MNELTPDEHKILVDAIQDSATVVHKGRKDMNERIRELREQAREYATTRHPVSNITLSVNSDLFEQKLAELIVQECILINRQRMFSDYEGDSHRVAHNNALFCANSDMFEHFGVGEQVIEPSELHTCPYAAEIHNDYETLCDCDEERTYQCAMDI